MDFRYEMPKKQKIIMIGYKKRVGKDTFADMLKNYLGCNKTQILRFADPIKDIVADFMHLSVEQLNDYKNKEIIVKDGYDNVLTNFRILLQNFGNNKMKDYFGDDVWAKLLVKKIDPYACYIIIPDFRCKVEYDIMCNTFGKENIITINIFKSDVDMTDTHKTENELYDFDFDYVINNDSDLSQFKFQASKLANIVKGE